MKIKILSQEYEVIEEKVIDRDGNLLGQVNLITNEISICSDMPKEKKRNHIASRNTARHITAISISRRM